MNEFDKLKALWSDRFAKAILFAKGEHDNFTKDYWKGTEIQLKEDLIVFYEVIDEAFKIGQNSKNKICAVCCNKFSDVDVCNDCLKHSKLAEKIRADERERIIKIIDGLIANLDGAHNWAKKLITVDEREFAIDILTYLKSKTGEIPKEA